MNINIKKAICSPFNTEKWYLKLGLLFLLTFFGFDPGFNGIIHKLKSTIKIIPHFLSSPIGDIISEFGLLYIIFFILIPISLFLGILGLGYLLQFSHNEINDITPLIPDWQKKHIKNYFKNGIIILLAMVFISFLLTLIDFAFAGLLHFILKRSNLFNQITWVYSYFSIYVEKILILIIFCFYSWRYKLKDIINITNLLKFMIKRKYELLILFLLMLVSYWFIEVISLYTYPVILPNIVLSFATLIFINLLAQIVKTNNISGSQLKFRESFSINTKKYWLSYIAICLSCILLININTKYLEKKYFNKIAKTTTSCLNQSKEIFKLINEDSFDKDSINKGINYCKESSQKLKKLKIPFYLSKKNKNFLIEYQKLSNSLCCCKANSYESLIYSDGNYSFSNESYRKYSNKEDICMKKLDSWLIETMNCEIKIENNLIRKKISKDFLKKIEDIRRY